MSIDLSHPSAPVNRRDGSFSVALSVVGTTEDTQAQYINVAGVLRRGSCVYVDVTSGAADTPALLLEENAFNVASGWINLFFMNTANGGYAGAGSVATDKKLILAVCPIWIRLRLTAIVSGIVNVHFTP